MDIHSDLKAINKDIEQQETILEKVKLIKYWLVKLEYIYPNNEFTIMWPQIRVRLEDE